jgi:hypothetical protein
MSIQVWHQPESGRIASKLQVARGWDSTFPALSACRRTVRDITKVARYEVPGRAYRWLRQAIQIPIPALWALSVFRRFQMLLE